MATYAKSTASNGVVLHSLKGSPNDIKLYTNGSSKAATTLLKEAGLHGINGGFFDGGDKTILSIAIQDGKAIGSNSGYNGTSNAGKTRGTLIWDASEKKFICKALSDKTAVEKLVSSTTNYWAQGGISMSLASTESAWKTTASNESMPNRDGSTYRAGIVYNSSNNIWLVISSNSCSAAAFRAAIKEKIGSNTLVDGIFLDGSTCAQMYSPDYELNHGRSVMAVIGYK